MPKAEQLPEDLRGFAFRQAAEVATGLDFRAHMKRLTTSLDRLLSSPGRPSIDPTGLAATIAPVIEDDLPEQSEPIEQPGENGSPTKALLVLFVIAIFSVLLIAASVTH
jgi:hypothetical protein